MEKYRDTVLILRLKLSPAISLDCFANYESELIFFRFVVLRRSFTNVIQSSDLVVEWFAVSLCAATQQSVHGSVPTVDKISFLYDSLVRLDDWCLLVQ